MAEKRRKKTTEMTPEEKLISEHAMEMELFLKLRDNDISPFKSRLPTPGNRFIMQVVGFAKFASSDHKVKGNRSQPTNQIVIRLDGVPTPSTPKLFDLAYLIFVGSDEELKKPEVVNRGSRLVLYIFYPFDCVGTVENILDSPVRCYAWIGNFTNPAGDVNYFAEIHAGYVRPKLV